MMKVLEELPDGVIIADKNNIRYINNRAWLLLNCRSSDIGKPIEEVMCVDPKLCSIQTPI
jgi:PAS domain-containing protein